MKRNLKVLGLALAAVFAMSAVAASAASAVQFHSSATTTQLSGEQSTQNVFTAAGTEVKCEKAKFTGESTASTTSSITVHPEYSGCTAFGFKTDVKTNSCNYVFSGLAGPPYTSGVEVECSGGSQIELTPTFLGASICTVSIGAQTPGGSIDFANVEAGGHKHVTVTSTANNIAYSVSGGGGVCGETANNGTYTGSVTEKGFSGEAQVNIWVE